MVQLSTIGYEGASIEDFIATLEQANIKTLIDVRQLPISRRKGFSKNILNGHLTNAGIRYVHLKGLGDPKSGRDAAKLGEWDIFIKIFSDHMKSEEALTDLSIAEKLAASGGACLMCYERNPEKCHRKLLVNYFSEPSIKNVKHLGIREGLAKHGSVRKGDDTR